MATSANFVWDPACFEVKKYKHALFGIVAHVPLVEMNFAAAWHSGQEAVRNFLQANHLENVVQQGQSLYSCPEKVAAVVSPFVEPGLVFKESADIQNIRYLLSKEGANRLADTTDVNRGQLIRLFEVEAGSEWAIYHVKGCQHLPQASKEMFDRVPSMGYAAPWTSGTRGFFQICQDGKCPPEEMITDLHFPATKAASLPEEGP